MDSPHKNDWLIQQERLFTALSMASLTEAGKLPQPKP